MVLLAMTLGILCALMVIASSASWTGSLTHAHSLELWWTVIPTSVILLAAAQTITVLYSADILGTSETIHIVAAQWYWTAGAEHVLDLRLAAEHIRLACSSQPIYLETGLNSITITAADVLHSLSFPTAGIKVDAVPGRIALQPLDILGEGTYSAYCSELCGSGHGFMPITLACYEPQDILPTLSKTTSWVYGGRAVSIAAILPMNLLATLLTLVSSIHSTTLPSWTPILLLATAWTCTATIATTSQSNEQLLLGTLPYISSSELAYTGLLAFEGMAFLGVGWTLVLARVAEPTILDLSQGILMAAGSLVVLLVVTLLGGLVHRSSWVQG